MKNLLQHAVALRGRLGFVGIAALGLFCLEASAQGVLATSDGQSAQRNALPTERTRIPSFPSATPFDGTPKRSVSSAIAEISARSELPPTRTGAQSRVDEETRWLFRSKRTASVGSSIVRLEDVAEPVDQKLPAWSRLRGAVVALVPFGRDRVVLTRSRLAAAVSSGEATPRRIDWIGPDQIIVMLRKSRSKLEASEGNSGLRPALARQVGAMNSDGTMNASLPSRRDTLGVVTAHATGPIESAVIDTASVDSEIRLDSAALDRMARWVEQAVRRDQSGVTKSFEIKLLADASNALELSRLKGITSITGLRFDENLVQQVQFVDSQPVTEWSADRPGLTTLRRTIRVIGRTLDGPVDAELLVELTPHPRVIVPIRTLPRGHRIGPGDLSEAPIPANRWRDDYVSDPEQLIGMEVFGSVRKDAPLSRSMVKHPTLIHRGDLIVLRVAGGGVSITTNAKAMADGHLSQLIEVETIEPKRRFVARVASTGVAEIVTRTPTVR
ncbi:MAG: flagellar basal body P-ring formation chaperone FlgA [Planctomycetota bacterium]